MNIKKVVLANENIEELQKIENELSEELFQ